ncbi:hypothetical protein PPACK8108_LOCUS687 [Phakopsora pachyrhizi]|uniref:Uncharacterized protein n=1 Tax=Phakopsora pachyrhizi TaxID=170000 RepID=A0AAV0AGQ5_PHAPC|nr:hypothetical protein PPACK8108_LOCUS687 [Phakopsora pachyrhizi]
MRASGSASKSITTASKPRSSGGVADGAVGVKSNGDPQGEGRWPGTGAPQPQAGNPEGDEELGKEVPQDWGTCNGGKQGAELPGERLGGLYTRTNGCNAS